MMARCQFKKVSLSEKIKTQQNGLKYAVISPDVKFSIHALDSPWKVVFYRVFDFINTICQCIFIGDWNRPIFSKKKIAMI